MRSFTIGLIAMLLASSAFASTRPPLESANKADMGKAAGEKQVDDANAAADEAKDIAAVQAYLSGISSIVANFTQESADGSKGSGKFFLKRPGKMRWQYAPPTPILLVSDGKVVTYYDAGLDQVTYIGVDDTLAGFLTRKDIQLNSDSTKMVNYSHENGVISIRIVQIKKPADGSLTLEFNDKPLGIKDMIAVDATGNATTVKLSDARFGPVLDDKLFVFEDPRGVNHKRNTRSN